jgi:phosphoribosylformylglycinamidine synthase
MDLKQAGSRIYLVGLTRDELGGSHLTLIRGLTGGQVPRVNGPQAKRIFAALHRAIHEGLVRACHDLSEGGLAVAAAEMAFAGNLGADLRLDDVVHDIAQPFAATLLFSESNTRFLCEVPVAQSASFEHIFQELPCRCVGSVTSQSQLRIQYQGQTVIASPLAQLKEAWQAPLRWQ